MSAPRAGRRWPAVAVAAGLAAWFAATVAAQHPDQAFDRVRDCDPTGALIPNWRFFAPEPGRHDFHLLHRVAAAGGGPSPWELTVAKSPRSWGNFAWMPDRRRDKAVFDLGSALAVAIAGGSRDLTAGPGYRLLRDYAEHAVRRRHAGGPLPEGFQFAVVRYAGYDERHDPEYLLVSPFVPLAG